MAKHCEYVQQLKHLKIKLTEIEDIIDNHKIIKKWACIIHDKDKNADGTPKEPHIHLYLNFGKSGASFDAVAKWFNDEPQYIDKVKGHMCDILLYLTHENAPEKHQYDISEVKSNFDLKSAIAEDKANNELITNIDDVVFGFAQEKITYSQSQKQLQIIKMLCNDRKVLDYWTKAFDQVQKLWKQSCIISTKGKRDMKIIFIYGESGSGKSTYAEMYADMLCKTKGYRDYARSSASNDIMQDYMGEDIFILDDFRDKDEMTGTSQSLTDVLKMLDPHFMSSSKSRYTNKTFTGKLIIITSTKDPLTWFEGTKEQRWQFFRRISMLIEITKYNVTEYQETNEEKGVPFLCGFHQNSFAFIDKAEKKTQFENPVPKYLELTGKTQSEESDMSADITAYLDSLKKDSPIV